MFGSPDEGAFKEMKRTECELILIGETREWQLYEYVRDAAQFGLKKTMIVLGHAASERDGMKHTADILSDMYPSLSVKYFECGEPFTYTDS